MISLRQGARGFPKLRASLVGGGLWKVQINLSREQLAWERTMGTILLGAWRCGEQWSITVGGKEIGAWGHWEAADNLWQAVIVLEAAGMAWAWSGGCQWAELMDMVGQRWVASKLTAAAVSRVGCLRQTA